MLSKMRKNMKAFSIFLWIVAASFVGTIFLVWGKGSISGPSANEVATVNGMGITLFEFNREYNRVLESLKKQFGNQYRKFIKEDDVKLIALRDLIRRKLILSLGEKEGIRVSDWAVAKEIESMPIFQKNGKFSAELYKRILAENHLTPEQFEREIRNDLLISKITSVVGYSPSVTKFELEKLYRQMFGERSFKYKLFKVNSENVTVSEKEIKDYYLKHKEEFNGSTREEVFAVKIPTTSPNAQDTAEKVFKLAKNHNFKELEKFKPQKISSPQIKNLLKNKAVTFKKEGNLYCIYFKKSTPTTKPLKEVKPLIEKLLKEQKGLKLAQEKAQQFLKSGEAFTNSTKPIDKTEFMKLFSPINPTQVEMAFKGKIGERFLLQTAEGFLVVSPSSKIKNPPLNPKKLEQIRSFILSEKRQSNEITFLNLLQQQASIKINKELLGLKQ